VPLAQRDSQLTGTHPTAWVSIRGDSVLPGWASDLVVAAILALLVSGVAFLAGKLGLRRRLSWLFALGFGCWLSAPFTADTAGGGLLAAAGLVVMPVAVVAEILLRRHDLDADTIR
jgi:hypothetical protein